VLTIIHSTSVAADETKTNLQVLKSNMECCDQRLPADGSAEVLNSSFCHSLFALLQQKLWAPAEEGNSHAQFFANPRWKDGLCHKQRRRRYSV